MLYAVSNQRCKYNFLRKAIWQSTDHSASKLYLAGPDAVTDSMSNMMRRLERLAQCALLCAST